MAPLSSDSTPKDPSSTRPPDPGRPNPADSHRPDPGRLDAIAPRHIRAEAAVWVTDLHAPDRDTELEERLRRWLAEDPRHAAAFELATEAWQRSGNLPAELPMGPPSINDPGAPNAARERRRRTPLSRTALAGIAALGLALTVTLYLLKDDTLSTGPSEQKTVLLTDGSQITLNANTRVRVHYDDHARSLVLLSGEALVNVAKHQHAPFMVLIDGRKVIAVGTAFEVRREDSGDSAFSVTLVEGRVAIEPASWPNELPISAIVSSGTAATTTGTEAHTREAISAATGAVAKAGTTSAASATANSVVLLSPGQRLRISNDAADRVDRPAIEKITAWQRGQLIFEDSSLRDAAAEFNRYGKLKLIIDPSVPSTLRVGGVFRIGDPTTFADAMVNAHHLQVARHNKEIVLTQSTQSE
jgi:transmembrane sensor